MSDLVIEAKDLTKHYGDFVAIDKLNFQVKRGEIVGLAARRRPSPNRPRRALANVHRHGFAAPTANRRSRQRR